MGTGRIEEYTEKTFRVCERSVRKNMQNRIIDWYFETVNRLKFCQHGGVTFLLETRGT